MSETAPPWEADVLLPAYEAATLAFPPDYDGEVVATLVRRAASAPQSRALLYVHGFIDYFFQAHMAERCAREGWGFYALDLRKHGRSLRPHQHPNFCKSVHEYFADITCAIDLLYEREGVRELVLAGHSTGGLVTALYADHGECRERVGALWLNSPFFEFNVPPAMQAQLALAAGTGRFFPFLSDPRGLSPDYPRSLHRKHEGEWDFDLRYKPIEGFPAYFGWIAAIRAAHARLHAGLAIRCPVLVMHSDAADIVLDARHIARWAPRLGDDVEVQAYPGALHDLVLSREPVREAVFGALFDWLSRRLPESH
ncbi:MAG: alpha/beta hydrolase [Betaproteobacteria bacterium]|nr:alpha/beta hydrolase [Betaproteobacteria bacterium]